MFASLFSNPYTNHYFQVPNPATPYDGEIPHGLQPGRKIIINGTVPAHASRFQIDLKTRTGSALHINPRFDQNAIVRNTDQNGLWGEEERAGELHLHKGKTFSIIIEVHQTHYKVVINGHHAFDYKHRVPYQEVNKLAVAEDVHIQHISYSSTHGREEGHSNLKVPFAVPLKHGAVAGRLIQIKGHLPQSSNRFEINLQTTAANQPNDIAMHTSVRFNDPKCDHPIVIRTNRVRGQWGHEERDQPSFPFAKGADFEVLLLLEESEWKIAVNGKHFASFKHRNNYTDVDHVGVQGDVEIRSINIF